MLFGVLFGPLSQVWGSIPSSYLKSALLYAVVIVASKKHTVFSLNLDIICVSAIFMFFYFFDGSYESFQNSRDAIF